MMENRSILCIVGPTACHKTETAVLLAHAFSAEIVSADSVQVYRDMDIGSAKPTYAEREGVVHHMIDCLPINTPSFSVSSFRTMACDAIDDILHRKILPIVVGGSGLYVNAITDPLNFAIPSDADMRTELSAAYDESPERSFSQLQSFDPDTASRLHPNDKKRIVRALEVYFCSGKPLSAYGNDFTNAAQTPSKYHSVWIGLNMNRNLLHERIEKRVELMMANGLEEEARKIYAAGYDRSLPAMQSIGYKQLFASFDGTISPMEAVEQIKRDTRRFARRQLTWFRRDTRIHWIDVTEYNDAVKHSIVDTAKELIVNDQDF